MGARVLTVSMRIPVAALVIAAVASGSELRAQSATLPPDLLRPIPVDHRVRATLQDGDSRVTGAFLAVDETALTLREEDRPRVVQLDVVRRFEFSEGRSRQDGAITGLWAGAVLGGALLGAAFATVTTDSPGCEFFCDPGSSFVIGAAVGAIYGAPVGMVLGALIGRERWYLVWER